MHFWYTDWDSASSRTHSCKNQPMFNKNNVQDPCRILSWSLIKATWIDQPREQQIKPQDICPIPIFFYSKQRKPGRFCIPAVNGQKPAAVQSINRVYKFLNISIYIYDIYLMTSTLCFLTLPCAYDHMHLELLSKNVAAKRVNQNVARVWWWSLPPTVPTSWIKPWFGLDALIVKSRPGGFQVTKISICYTLRKIVDFKSVLGRDMLVC